MATNANFRDIQQIASASLQTPYTVAAGITSSKISVMSFTNAAATGLVIDIYHNDGTTDFLKKTIRLPAGIGQEEIYYGFERNVMLVGDSIKVQADAATAFNMFIHGTETSP